MILGDARPPSFAKASDFAKAPSVAGYRLAVSDWRLIAEPQLVTGNSECIGRSKGYLYDPHKGSRLRFELRVKCCIWFLHSRSLMRKVTGQKTTDKQLQRVVEHDRQ